MSLSSVIARRYLFSRKSHSAINIIAAISATGIALATAALIVVLSVFNGFSELIGGLYSTFDPPLKVVPAAGKTTVVPAAKLAQLRQTKGVGAVSEVLEEKALILFRGAPLVVTVKGVDAQFAQVTHVERITHEVRPNYETASLDTLSTTFPALTAAGIEYAVPGAGLARRMGVAFGTMQLVAPRRGELINMANPLESLNVADIRSTGGTTSGHVFEVSQKKYDDQLLLTSLPFARELFEQPDAVSALELSLSPGADAESVKARVEAVVGKNFRVMTRIEQHEDMFRLMSVEKLIAYFFLTFIVLIASFNLIGSVSMLIIDKRANVQTLRALGMQKSGVSAIFQKTSRLITLIGAAAGVVLGLAFCWAQQTFGLIKFGTGDGTFIIDVYPISVAPLDVAIVPLTVIVVGFLVAFFPIRWLCARLIEE